MADSERWPVRIAAIGPVAVGTVLWRIQEQWSVTAIVKGTFELTPDAPMRPVEPEPLSETDRHEHDSPNQSLCIACETAPQLPQAEVVVFGRAHAAAGPDGAATATRSTIRLALVQGSSRPIDKTLLVIGDRSPGALEPTPFTTIALGWERCLGGAGCPENPFGVGLGGSTNQLPNFLDPTDPGRRVTSLGPVPRIFSARRSRLGSGPRPLREEWGVLEIEPGFDWDYFQCAMPDQRVRSLRGDEWIELEGLTEELRLRTRLPAARALARNYGPREPLIPDWIPLVPDLVQIYAHRRRCTVVWRGGFPVESAESAERLLLVAGLELAGEPLRWPRSAEELQASAPRSTASAARSGVGGPAGSEGGRRPSGQALEREAMAGATVDAAAIGGAAHGALPWEQSARPATSGQPSASSRAGAERSSSPAAAAFPWEQGARARRASEPPPLSTDEKEAAWGATASITAEEAARAQAWQRAPFEIAKPKPPASERAERAVPGAPWSGERLPPLPPTKGETTVVLTSPPVLDPDGDAARGAKAPAHRNKAAADTATEAANQLEAQRAEAARLEAERAEAARLEAERAEAARLKAEAEVLRADEAERFAAEQAAARAEAERRAAEEAERRNRAAGELRTGMYGAFKRKR